MKNPIFDPKSEDVFKRLEELSDEFDDPTYVREAKALVETLYREVHRSNYLSGADFIRLTFGNHKVKTSGEHIPSSSDMYNYYRMYKNGHAARSRLNQGNFKIGFRVVRSKV